MKKIIVIIGSIALLIVLTLGCWSCTKTEEVLTENQVKQVILTCYSEKGIINLKYIDLNRNWIDTIINSKNTVIIYNQIEDNYQFDVSLKSNSADSLHLKAECELKKTEKGYRSNVGQVNISVQLTDLK